jgi:chromosome segregation protein
LVVGGGEPVRVVSLEVAGFKSFADRLTLPLADGLTAVIGPNGTGKSNLTDAVRWALGEQRPRPLRVERMEDLLFAGEGARRAAGMAECALVLDNADGRLPVPAAEVEVRRRLYRSGDSEYLVNRQPVRLRDVEGLLAAAGIKADGFHLVAQGRVDEALRARPEERRRMVEEAAGVAALEAERRQALQLLDSQDGALAVLAERRRVLAERLSELAEAAERAGEERRLLAESRRLQVAIGRRDLDRQMAARDRAEAEAARARRDRHDAEQQAAAAAERQRELMAVLQRREAGAQRVRQLRRQAEARQAEAARAADAARQAARDVALRREALAERHDQLTAALDRARAEAAAAAERRQVLAERARHAAAALSELEGLERAWRDHLRAVEERQRVEAAEQAAAKAAALVQEVAAARADLEARRQEAAAAARRVAEARASREVRAAEAARADRAAAERRAAVTVLAAALRDGEGHAQGTRAVLAAAARGELAGVCGAVGDLLTVPAGLEAAIDAALGAATSDIVVRAEADARAAIAHLRRVGGRATFLPLDLLRPRPPLDLPAEVARLGRPASAWVEVADPYRPVRDHLLGRTLVVDTLEEAVTAARALGMRLRVVTRDGDLVAPGGAITGGRARPASGRLARRRELEEARHGERQAAQAQAAAAAALAEAEARLARESEAQAVAERRRAVAEGRCASLAQALDEARLRAEAARRAATPGGGAPAEPPASSRPAPEALAAARRAAAEAARELAAAEGRGDLVEERPRALAAELAEVRRRLDALAAGAPTAAVARAEAAALAARLPAAAARSLERCAEAAERAMRGLAAVLAREEGRRRGQAEALSERLQARTAEAEAAAERAAQTARRLREAYGEEALDGPPPAVPAGAEARLRQVEARRQALGGVDGQAEVRYREALARAEALEADAAELEEGRRALLRLAEQVERRLARAFSATLEQVRRGFAEACAALLEGEGEVLETADGLDLRVRLPGKRRVPLLGLSGGERSLAALAFLFSLLAAGGGGFYVLDEVEAALDGPNAARFARYLSAWRGAQFLVITHQRATMEAARAIVGFTAQEAGVSHLVAVRLEDAESA